MSTAGVPFVKGHGTENDFILLPDAADTLEVTGSQVRALCDRRAGLGADGVIRVAPARSGAHFFMDYRNADGSLAEMCGNGARVFARFLVDAGWERNGSFDFATRGGLCAAAVDSQSDISIAMGSATLGRTSEAVLAGTAYVGTVVDVGNPHLVCMVSSADLLDDLDLTTAPLVDVALFPTGVNVEFVVPLPDGHSCTDGNGHIRMRVFERGVGETRSCGTGTIAAAAAFLATKGMALGRVNVHVPGGSVLVEVSASGAILTGPAVMVAAGVIDPQFWAQHR
ncbi:MAG: diaminopimelate epimerase [Nakamurella sp.]